MSLRPAYPLQTERLRLRPLGDADVPDLVAYRSLAAVCRWVPFEPMSEEGVRERMHGIWARQDLDAAGQALTLGVELKTSGTVVGDVMLLWSSLEHRSGEVGWVLNPAFGGHGYATEATHAVLHVAFGDLGLHRVIARVDAENVASAALARRLGMRQEAHLVENEWFKGHWSDELQFGLLDREWRALDHRHCASAAQE